MSRLFILLLFACAVFCGLVAPASSAPPKLIHTVTTITSTPNPANFGDSVTLTASVTVSGQPVTSGTVTFYDSAVEFDSTTELGTGSLIGPNENNSGTASVTTSTLSVGSHGITAQFTGQGTLASSQSQPLLQTVYPKIIKLFPTLTTLTASPGSPVYGTPVTLTAAVTASGSPLSTGTVTFYDGTVSLAVSTLTGAGTATLQLTGLSGGTHTLTVQYSGQGNYLASVSAPLIEAVQPAGVSLTLLTTPTPGVSGQPVTVTASFGGSSPILPSGTVTFYDIPPNSGGNVLTILGIVPVNAAQVSVTVPSLAPGTHTLSAAYSGDTNYTSAGTASLAYVVRYADALALTAGPNPASAGQPVTLTAANTGFNPALNGTVTFYDGTVSLGVVTLSTIQQRSVGVVKLTAAALSPGVHSLTAAYSGDALNSPATSAPILEFVNAAPTPPAPTLLSSDPAKPVLSPAYLPAGSANTTLTVTGQNFDPAAQVSINGIVLAATLIQNQSTTQIVVTVPAVLLVNPGALEINVLNPNGVLSNSVSLNVLGAEDVTASVSVAFLGQRLDRATGNILRAYRLTNIGKRLLPGALSLAIDGLTHAKMTNTVGQTKYKKPVGSSYVPVSASDLAPGQSVTVQIAFAKTGVGAVSYTERVLAGVGAR